MDSGAFTNQKVCPRGEIAAYLDDELSPSEELVLEQHFTVCQTCLDELNLQKKLLSALDFAFESRSEIELPKNFTKIVVANAESSVKGLRSKKERFWALSLGSTFFLLTVIGLGAESNQVFDTFSEFCGQFLAVGSFLFHTISDVAVGFAVILRSLSQKVVFSSGFLAILLICVIAIIFLSFSRIVLRLGRS